MNSNIISIQNNLDAYLPKDIFIEISSFLPYKDFIVIGRVCKLWQEHSSNDIVWRQYSEKRWPDYTKFPDISWKEHFQSNYKGSFYSSLTQSNSGNHCAKNNILYLYKNENMFPTLKMSSHKGSINQIIILSYTDPIHYITCASDGYIKIWNNNVDDDCLFEKKIHSKAISCMELLKETLFTGFEDGIIKIWKLQFNENYSLEFIDELKGLKEHGQAIKCIKVSRISPCSYQIISGSQDASIGIWKMKGNGDSYLSQTLKSHKSAITTLKMHKRTNCLISGSIDKTIKIWSINQYNLYECVQTLEFHQSTVTALIANPLSNYFFSSDNTGHIVIWKHINKQWYFESVSERENAEIYDMKFKEKRPQVTDFTKIFSLASGGELCLWTLKDKPIEPAIENQ